MRFSIRCDVTRVLCNVQFQEAPPAPPPPEFITTHFDPLTGEDNSRDIDAGTLGLVTTRVPPLQIAPPGDFTEEERSEEHTSELQSLMRISYAVFCLKKKKTKNQQSTQHIHINT